MALYDLPLEQLRTYRPEVHEPEDLDAFWSSTLDRARRGPALVSAHRVETGLETVDTWDVTFSGHGEAPIRAWYTRPSAAGGELPVVVEYLGYNGGRGLPLEHLVWASAGYGHLLMDSRGQGSGWGSGGDTFDPGGSGPAAAGMMTRGIESPETHYMTRLVTDAVRAVDAARELPGADGRVVVCGTSQGGALAIAAAGLAPDVVAALPDVPFLCHIRRAVDLTDDEPYRELVRYLAVHRNAEAMVFRTLAYVDMMHLGRRAHAPALFSVALRDVTCPPSTVFAAYNHYGELGGEPARDIEVYPYNGHEGGGAVQMQRRLAWLRERV